MAFKSPYAPVQIPEDINFWSLMFAKKARDFPDSKVIFTDAETDRNYTYADVRNVSLDVGRALQARWGWQRGDVLALYTPNCVDTPATMLGVIWAGGVVSPANPLYTQHELEHQLRDSGAKALLTQVPFLEMARRAARTVGIPEDRILLIGDQKDPSGKFVHIRDFAPSTSATAASSAPVRVEPKRDLVFIVYSSGTTGMPKGVCLSHYNLISNVVQVASVDGLSFYPNGGINGQGDKALGITPFFHVYGLVCCVMNFIYNGWELVVMARFDIERACQLIEKHRLTFGYVPPPVILALSKHPIVDKYDLTSMRYLTSAAAPLSAELVTAMWDRLKIGVGQGYGLSETSPVTTVQFAGEWGKFMGSTGKLVPNMEGRLVDPDTGKDVTAVNTPGELWVRGPNIFLGYLNLPENTAACMSEDGYFKTGDIFVRDKHDNLYCVDRLKELIKYKGFQVPPAELEGLLLDHPEIADAAVIGVENRAEATEVPRAYIVLKDSRSVASDAAAAAKAQELIDWLAKQTAPHKKLRGGVRFVAEIPKSASGKLLRRVLRDQAREEAKAGQAKL